MHADRLAGLHEQRLVVLRASSACGRWRRSSPSRARPGRCRRRRRGRRGARRPRGRGCSSASAAAPRSASCARSASSRAARGRVGLRHRQVLSVVRKRRGSRWPSRHSRGWPRADSAAATAVAAPDGVDGRLDLRGQVPVGARARTPAAQDRVTHRAVAGAGASGARRSRARAAVRTSIASTRVEPVHRAAQLAGRGPAHRDVVLLHRRRRDRVDARRRGEPLELADDRRPRVLGDHVARSRRRGRRRGTAAARGCARRRGSGRCAARTSTPRRRPRWPGSRARSRRARRGSCRWTPRGRRRSRPGCRSAAASSRAATSGGVRRRCRAPRRAPAARSAASRRPGPGALRSAVAGHDRAARRAGARRLAARGGLARVRPQRLQVGGEDGVGAEQAPRRSWPPRCRRSRSSSRRSGRARTSMPSIPSVPLMSASPSFSASSTGAIPASRERLGRRRAGRRRRRAPRPRPSARARQCASGARSPEQPSEPYSCTTGVMPASSIAA